MTSQTSSTDPWTNLSEDYSNKDIDTDEVFILGESLKLSDCEAVGRGGAAIVYRIKSGPHQGKALKLYHGEELSKRGRILEAKIKAMIQAPPSNRDLEFSGNVTPQFVWPEVEAVDADGQFVGFVMPYLDPSSYYILSEYLYETNKLEPKHQSITERVQVCRNLASAVLSLHKVGHYFVDMKPQNIFVHKEQSTVTFIDCDGFSISNGEFPCYQYSPSYIAPEYIAKRPENELSRSGQQDEFVLAVLLFQILDFGNHPYSCRIQDDSILPPDGDQSLNSRVANELYPYDNKIAGISPKAHSIYSYWPDSLREQFDKSFRNIPRPSAESWYALLHFYIENWESTFSRCEQNPDDMAHRHFKGLPCYACKEFGQAEKEKEEAKKKATEDEERKITEERRKAAQEEARKKAVREEDLRRSERVEQEKRKRSRKKKKILIVCFFLIVLGVWFFVLCPQFICFRNNSNCKVSIYSTTDEAGYIATLSPGGSVTRCFLRGYLFFEARSAGYEDLQLFCKDKLFYRIDIDMGESLKEKAESLYKEKKYEEAYELYSKMKNSYDFDMYRFAVVSYLSNHIDVAIDYFNKCCDSNYNNEIISNSYDFLGRIYLNNEITEYKENDRKISFECFLKSSDLGNEYGARNLCWSYLNGNGVQRNVDYATVIAATRKFNGNSSDLRFQEKLLEQSSIDDWLEMVDVPSGTFTMVSNANDKIPFCEVELDAFSIGKYEVTQGLWKAVVGNNPSKNQSDDSFPVETVSWEDVQVFLNKLNQLTGKNYRLPTEAEWEYAARSCGKPENWAGVCVESELGKYAWYDENSGRATHPVGQKRPNGLGIHDMSGNVMEWCQGWYAPFSHKFEKNPLGSPSGSYRLVRGGNFLKSVSDVQVTKRLFINPKGIGNLLGFRLALSDK